MKAEEWQKGMENEAASVEDVEWAEDTRQTAQVLRRRSQLSGLLLALSCAVMFSTLLLILNILGSRVGMHVDQNAVGTFIREHTLPYLASLLALVFLLGLGLGRACVTPWLAALAFLLLPVLSVILGTLVYVPSTVEFDSSLGVMAPVTIDLATVFWNVWMVPEAVLAAAFAFLGARLGQARKRPSPPPTAVR